MERSVILLSLGTVLLFSIYLFFAGGSIIFPLYAGWLYFSNIGFIILNALAIVAALAFFFSYRKTLKTKLSTKKPKLDIYLVIGIVIVFILLGFKLAGLATIVTVAGVILAAFIAKNLKSYKFYAAVIACLIVTSFIAYLFILNPGSGWHGVDEMAFDYYASYLLIHGVNPYTASMQPIISRYNISTTLQLNGSPEYNYNYPAFGFIPLIFMPLIGSYSPYTFTLVLILLTTFVSFFIYYKSNYNGYALIPITVLIFITYIATSTVDQYLAVSVFLLIAYIQRKNIFLSSVFLGLAASTIQLAWFALPFFFVLTIRESGNKALYKSLLIVLLVFLAINGYFIINAPHQYFNDVFGIFGSSKLVPGGPNLGVVLIRSYPVASWYLTLIPAIVLLSSIALFYFYTSTLKPLLVLVPAFIFFLSWRNLSIYSLPFVFIIIAMCYIKEKKEIKDILTSKRPMVFVIASVLIISSILLVYAHGIYLHNNTLSINSIKATTTQNSIKYLAVNITNNGNSMENVSFLLINRYPDTYEIITNTSNMSIMSGSYRNYRLNFSIGTNTRNTSMYVIAFSTDYIASREIYINLNSTGT